MDRINVIFIPIVFYAIIAVAAGGFAFQGIHFGRWTFSVPAFTPSATFIGLGWMAAYAFSAISLSVFLDKTRERLSMWPILGLYFLNGILNAAWSNMFFLRRILGLAVLDSMLVGATLLLIMVCAWPYSRISSLLLLPHLCWLSFSGYLSYAIFKLNPQ